jgi:hypothetical protein
LKKPGKSGLFSFHSLLATTSGKSAYGRNISSVMPALGAGIHEFIFMANMKKVVDGRDKPGHDGVGSRFREQSLCPQ